MSNYLKAIAIIVILFAGLGVSTFATSRPGETWHFARAAARGLCAMPGGMTAPACRSLTRFRAIRTSLPQKMRS